VLRGACTVARGHPDNPMTEAERHAKFRLCAAAAAQPPSEARIREIIAAVDKLENMPDVSSLAALLA
jgi:2-methylcitrate dehydratase PrpD